MRKESLYYDYAFLLHEFLTPEECRAFIDLGEAEGFHEATVTTRRGQLMRKDIRNNSRVIHDDAPLAEQIWARAKPWFETPWRGLVATGLNERFRFYRYEPGEYFAPHTDGPFKRENGECSHFTFLMYLNDDFTGGHTIFHFKEPLDVAPKAGSVLVFHHPLLHEGAVVESGVKYVLRSDVMYADPNAVCTEERPSKT